MRKTRKTVVIFEHKGGRLGNQLWNYASVLAYCFEKGFDCKNPTFREYGHIFESSQINHRILNALLSYVPGRIRRKVALRRARRIKERSAISIIYSGNDIGQDTQTPFYLPPSENKNMEQAKALGAAGSSPRERVYFSGWLFRNPVGMMKYQKEIAQYFRPSRQIAKKVESSIKKMRGQYDHIVGVHIRKKDYEKYWGGRFYFTDQEIRPMLESYLAQVEQRTRPQQARKTVFIICSDGAVDVAAFAGLNVVLSNGSAGEDLFLLSACDVIVGSDSTFGAIAAYFGNIPIVFFQKGEINWGDAFKKGYNYHNGSLNIQP